jgi:hypothetical protein
LHPGAVLAPQIRQVLDGVILDFYACGEVSQPIGKLPIRVCERIDAPQHVTIKTVLSAE